MNQYIIHMRDPKTGYQIAMTVAVEAFAPIHYVSEIGIRVANMMGLDYVRYDYAPA